MAKRKVTGADGGDPPPDYRVLARALAESIASQEPAWRGKEDWLEDAILCAFHALRGWVDAGDPLRADAFEIACDEVEEAALSMPVTAWPSKAAFISYTRRGAIQRAMDRRRGAGRRARREEAHEHRRSSEQPVDGEAEGARAAFRADLDDALDALARKNPRWHDAYVACDVHGEIQRDYARRSGLSEAAVSGYLTRARLFLKDWLAARGYAADSLDVPTARTDPRPAPHPGRTPAPRMTAAQAYEEGKRRLGEFFPALLEVWEACWEGGEPEGDFAGRSGLPVEAVQARLDRARTYLEDGLASHGIDRNRLPARASRPMPRERNRDLDLNPPQEDRA